MSPTSLTVLAPPARLRRTVRGCLGRELAEDTMVETTDAPSHVEGAVTFDEGIPGFPGSSRFRLVTAGDDAAFQVLESLDEEAVALLVTHPWLFFPDYAPELADSDREHLELDSPEEAALFCAVTVDGERREAWANLRAPFVVNTTTRRGRQVVLVQDAPLRAPLPISW